MLGRRAPDLVPEGRDAVIAFDVEPVYWLRYQALLSPAGTRLGRDGALIQPHPADGSAVIEAICRPSAKRCQSSNLSPQTPDDECRPRWRSPSGCCC